MKFSRELLLPCAICAASFAAALVLAIAADVGGTRILRDYLVAGLLASYLALLLWCFLPWLRAAEHRGLPPIRAAVAVLAQRWPLLILPTLILPVFMTGFTVSKISFPYLTGYQWDGFWTAADAFIFNGDPWRVTHRLIGPAGTSVLVWCYTMGWGVAIGMAMPLYALSAEPRRVAHAFSALMTSWFVIGVAGATIFSSAGPIFADMVDPALAQHFAPLKQSLAALLPNGDPVAMSQQYLREAAGHREALRGGGISAMPSMHLGVCSFLVILAWRSWWRIPAILLWLAIWVGSIHFGYHYALDGFIAAPLAWLCWRVTSPRPPVRAPAAGPALAAA